MKKDDVMRFNSVLEGANAKLIKERDECKAALTEAQNECVKLRENTMDVESVHIFIDAFGIPREELDGTRSYESHKEIPLSRRMLMLAREFGTLKLRDEFMKHKEGVEYSFEKVWGEIKSMKGDRE